MQIDLEQVPSGTKFESEICVIGAGIAGLILARRLAGYGMQVHLLEAGGLELEERSQQLYRSEMRGAYHQGTIDGRFRTYGGSSTQWGGQLLAYPDAVFRDRPLLGAGWPITENEVRPYYPEIFKIMGVNELPFTDDFLQRYGTREALRSPDVRVRLSKFAPFGRRNLAGTIGREVLASDKITVFFHANAVTVNATPAGDRIEDVTVRNYGDGEYRFQARQFIVCAGTIETSRLLLTSRILEKFDQVGRYFHDHFRVKALDLGPQSRRVFEKYFSPYYQGSTLHSPKIEATEATMERLGLPEVMAHFFIHEGESEFGVLRQALVGLQRGKFSAGTLLQAPKLLTGAARMAYALKVKGRRILSSGADVTMNIETEQRPRRDSRIQISEERNAVGIPKTIVDWKVSDEEGIAVKKFAGVLDTYLKSLGMTDLAWKPGPQDDLAAWFKEGYDIYHPMGGARMGDSPETSVVDRNLRVHGMENLHVASCATYPSGGSSNPTFTLMGLSCRLADELKQKR
jgi:choline dehydrogenase-like flavoprotein